MPPTLETRNLTRIVEDDRLVDGVSVMIRDREVIVIIGPSGAGKSSFLRLLNRLDEPTAGTVLLDGVDYHEIPPREPRVRVGLVPQSPALVPGTVYENATRGLTLRNEPIDAERTTQILT